MSAAQNLLPIAANIVPQERLAVFRKSCQNP